MALPVKWRKVLRELWGSKARTLLVVLAIAAGVFAVGTIANSWIILLNDLNTAYLATDPASAVLTLEPFGEDVASAVEGMREVAVAEGRATVIVKLNTPDGEQINLTLYAVEDYADLRLSRMTPETGDWPPRRRELFVERSWAGSLPGVEPGDTVTVETPDGELHDLTFGGLAHDLHHPAAFVSDMSYGYVTLDTLEWLGQSRRFDRLYLTVAEGADNPEHIAAVVADVKDRLAQSGYTTLATSIPTPGEHFAAPFVQAMLLILGVLGGFSLLMSGALVLNTVAAVVTRQTRQIAVMKAIGGRRSQIMGIYIASAAIFGALSLVLAVPLALVGTRSLTGFIAGIVNFDVLTTHIPPLVIVLEAIIGLLFPVVAALIPVLAGTAITVREAIGSHGIADQGGGLMARLTGPAGIASSRVVLAFRNVFRRKVRLALTLMTLTVAGAIFVAVLSVRASLMGTFDQVLGYFQYDVSTDFNEAYRIERIEREAKRFAEVTRVEGWLKERVARVRPDGTESTNYLLFGVPPESDFLDPVLIDGRWLRPDDANAVVVSADFRNDEPDIRVGDTLTLAIGDDEIDWQVVGIVTTQFSEPPYLYTSRAALGRELNRVGFANRVLIELRGGSAAQEKRLAPQIEERFKDAGLLVGSTTANSDFVQSFEQRFTILTVFMLFMATLLAVVGGFGLAGTMGLNVLERVREIGVMRAIGASDGAVRAIVLGEGAAIGVLSWLAGSLIALPLSKVLSDGVGVAFGGEPLTFSFSLTGIGLWLGLVIVISTISSYIPAQRAARLSVRETLAYE
jgi:putative ABC transport system permease protein